MTPRLLALLALFAPGPFPDAVPLPSVGTGQSLCLDTGCSSYFTCVAESDCAIVAGTSSISVGPDGVIVEPGGAAFTVPSGFGSSFGVSSPARFANQVQFGSFTEFYTGASSTSPVMRTQLDSGESLRHMLHNGGGGSAYNFAIGAWANRNDASWGIPTSTDPTLWVFSATSPSTDATEWVSITHNQTDAVIDAGKGSVSIGTWLSPYNYGGAPTATDCDAANEEGRVARNGASLYICDRTGSTTGWQLVYDGST